MSGEIFDTEGNLVDVDVQDVDPFDSMGMPQLNGAELAQALSTITSTGTQLSEQARRVMSLFDGSKTVNVGAAQAPIGLVLGAGLLAVLAYHHTKGRR